jgi:hypothetical protein
MIDKNISTLIAVGGTVIIAISLIVYYGISGYILDSKPIELIVSGLMGFAAGGAVKTLVDNGNTKNE